MRIKYQEPKDERITVKRSFLKEYLIILGVVMVCCSGAVLMFGELLSMDANPWYMVVCIGSYVCMMVFFVSIATRYIMRNGYRKPITEIGQAARKVATGDFTVRIHSMRKDDKKDELEVLIDDFNTMVEELSTIQMLKSDFLANVSHEMKTPLSVIQGYASVLNKDEITEEERHFYAQTVLEASKKLTALVTNILKLNKLEIQEIVQKEKYSLDEQIRCCILALEDKFEEKDIELDVDLKEVTVQTDESLLEIVWNNLLTNAIKFTDPHGQVKIRLREEKNTAVVEVADTGCGMPKETCNRIFERFYQGDTSHSLEGNGLGLSLVKRVIELVHGEIQVESEPGRGTTFYVKLNL